MRNHDLTRGSISKHLRMIAIPASVGFIFNTLYNVIDSWYAGLVSTEALAALGIAFPVFFIIIALGSGIGTGTTALISNKLGAKKESMAKVYAVQSISFTIIIAVLLTIAGLILSPLLFNILGASGTYFDIATSYMNVIFYATVFFMLTFNLNAILNAQGDTRTFRNFLIVGFFLNLVLNPAFMFGWLFFPEMGLVGVAWATFTIQVLGAAYLAYKVKKTGVLDGVEGMKLPNIKIYSEISKQGFPAGLNMMTIAIGIFVITYFLSSFGKEAVAAYGVATRIEQIFLLPTIGLNIATLAIVGQNNGAEKFNRVKETISTAIKYGLIVMTVAALMLLVLAEPMMQFFTSDSTVVALGSEYLRIAAFITWAYVILNVNVSALQGIKKPMFALYMGLYRQIVAPIIIFTLLTRVMGIAGVWWGIFITVWSGAAITIWYARKQIIKIGIEN